MKVERRDAIDGLRSLASGSVGMLLSDLPSGETQATNDTAPDLDAFWPEAWRVLAPRGAVVLMCSSLRFASRVLASQERYFRHDLIWHKSLATGHLNAKKSPLRAHEFILVFAQKAPIYTPQMAQGASPIHAARQTSLGRNYGAKTQVTHSRTGATDRYPTSVLQFASVGTSAPERVHHQQKPVPLLRWLIRAYSTADALVVDPYAGSGSTGVAALAEGRHFRGFDLDKYV